MEGFVGVGGGGGRLRIRGEEEEQEEEQEEEEEHSQLSFGSQLFVFGSVSGSCRSVKSIKVLSEQSQISRTLHPAGTDEADGLLGRLEKIILQDDWM